MSSYNLVRSGPNFTTFFLFNAEKIVEATPFGTKNPSFNTLHFKPIFDSASKTWPFSSACKNYSVQHPLGAEMWLSK